MTFNCRSSPTRYKLARWYDCTGSLLYHAVSLALGSCVKDVLLLLACVSETGQILAQVYNIFVFATLGPFVVDYHCIMFRSTKSKCRSSLIRYKLAGQRLAHVSCIPVFCHFGSIIVDFHCII
ncbi:unnamed protein product [Pylaiella littoralis]